MPNDRAGADAADPLARNWTIVLVAPTMAAHVRGTDLIDFDPTTEDLESGRQFSATWGFERHEALDHAIDLLDDLSEGLEPDVAARIRASIESAGREPETIAERSFGAAARVLVSRLEQNQRELSTLKAALAAETQQATREHLTGLLNREGLQRWLGGTHTDGLPMPPMGVVLIDLDGFKQINDTRGHLAGDLLLRGVAASLLEATRPGDVVARWGGDESVVLCPNAADRDLQVVARRLLDAIARVDAHGAAVTASAGIQTCSQRPLPLGDADSALYEAKSRGGGLAVAATQ